VLGKPMALDGTHGFIFIRYQVATIYMQGTLFVHCLLMGITLPLHVCITFTIIRK
jgi:hypothetical protein